MRGFLRWAGNVLSVLFYLIALGIYGITAHNPPQDVSVGNRFIEFSLISLVLSLLLLWLCSRKRLQLVEILIPGGLFLIYAFPSFPDLWFQVLMGCLSLSMMVLLVIRSERTSPTSPSN